MILSFSIFLHIDSLVFSFVIFLFLIFGVFNFLRSGREGKLRIVGLCWDERKGRLSGRWSSVL